MASELEITVHEDAVAFAVRVVPRARRDEIQGIEGGALKVRVTAPPVGGKANRAVIEFLAERLGVGRSQIEIISGERSRRKVVKLSAVSESDLIRRMKV